MTIATGIPLGTPVTGEEIYLEGAPWIYFQDSRANPQFNPDQQGYYWGLSGTAAYPVYALGCVQDVQLGEDVTMNDVRCDTVGTVATVQRRNYVEFTVTILSLFPLSQLAQMLNLSVPSTGSGYEKVGIGPINNNISYHVYAPKVYDDSVSDWLLFYLHTAKFVDAWTIAMTYGDSWKVTGIKFRAYADPSKPSAQQFGAIMRFDPSALP